MSSWGGGNNITGTQVRERCEKLNRRLAALGVFSTTGSGRSPRLPLEDWEKLTALAEAGAAAKAEAAPVPDPAESPR
jgi:hypothetical protein